jgi:hypothetical protein
MTVPMEESAVTITTEVDRTMTVLTGAAAAGLPGSRATIVWILVDVLSSKEPGSSSKQLCVGPDNSRHTAVSPCKVLASEDLYAVLCFHGLHVIASAAG